MIQYIEYTKGPHSVGAFCIYGAPGRIRTSDHLVRSQVLYPAELRALISFGGRILITLAFIVNSKPVVVPHQVTIRTLPA